MLAVSIHCAHIVQMEDIYWKWAIEYFFLSGITFCALGPLLDLHCVTPRDRHFMIPFSDGAMESGQVKLLQMSCRCHRDCPVHRASPMILKSLGAELIWGHCVSFLRHLATPSVSPGFPHSSNRRICFLVRFRAVLPRWTPGRQPWGRWWRKRSVRSTWRGEPGYCLRPVLKPGPPLYVSACGGAMPAWRR